MSAMLMAGDALTRLRELPGGFANVCVTSPPYFNLRSYQGGAEELGREATPDEYARHLVEVLREARRVLRDDGSLWLVIGDSYANTGGHKAQGASSARTGRSNVSVQNAQKGYAGGNNIKIKDLLMIPALVAMTLRTDGWYLRSDIAWVKSNPMPESTFDRPTQSYEHVFMLTKTPRYYFDMEAVREPNVSPEQAAHNQRYAKPYTAFDDRAAATGQPGNVNSVGKHARPGPGGRHMRNVWEINPEPFTDHLCGACKTRLSGTEYRRLPKSDSGVRACPACGASGAWLSHFAVFPTRLVSRCLRASMPEGGCCARCGAPTKRVLADAGPDLAWQAASGADRSGGYAGTSREGGAASGAQDASATKARILAGMRKRETIGFEPTCACGTAERMRPVVLDPFCGAGSALLSATRLSGDAIGIDLNPDYLRLADARLRDPLAKCLDSDAKPLPFVASEVSTS
jgi:site-specific DNA-methyltransferase (cytosine-N4-specific)